MLGAVPEMLTSASQSRWCASPTWGSDMKLISQLVCKKTPIFRVGHECYSDAEPCKWLVDTSTTGSAITQFAEPVAKSADIVRRVGYVLEDRG